MSRRSNKKRNIKSRPAQYNVLDSHRWESKMEIIRLISGKPDIKIKPLSETAS